MIITSDVASAQWDMESKKELRRFMSKKWQMYNIWIKKDYISWAALVLYMYVL